MKRPCPRSEEVLKALVQGDLSQELTDHVVSCLDCTEARQLTFELRDLPTPEPAEDLLTDARRIWGRAAAARRLAGHPDDKTTRLALWGPLLGAVAAIVLVAAFTALASALDPSRLAADEAFLTAGLGLILGSGLLLFLGASASMALAWDHI